MEYLKLRKLLKEHLYFSVDEIAFYTGIKKESARVLCSRYVKNGLIIRLKKNLYILKEKWEILTMEDYFKIANILQVPSYISLMTALFYYEITTQIQRNFFESVCLKKSKSFSIEGSEFYYYKISRRFYSGFERTDKLFIAKKEKAFVDVLYLYSLGKYKFDISSIDFKKLDKKRVEKYIEIYPEKTKRTFKKIWRI